MGSTRSILDQFIALGPFYLKYDTGRIGYSIGIEGCDPYFIEGRLIRDQELFNALVYIKAQLHIKSVQAASRN